MGNLLTLEALKRLRNRAVMMTVRMTTGRAIAKNIVLARATRIREKRFSMMKEIPS